MRREVDAVRSAVRISLGVKDDESLNRSWVAINEMMCSRFNAAFEKRTGTPKRATALWHTLAQREAGGRAPTGTRYIDYTVARNYEATLPALFAELDKRKDELGIIDVNLGMVTLEDVFLAIAKQAEARSSTTPPRFRGSDIGKLA